MKQPVPSGRTSYLAFTTLANPAGLWEGWRPLALRCLVVVVVAVTVSNTSRPATQFLTGGLVVLGVFADVHDKRCMCVCKRGVVPHPTTPFQPISSHPEKQTDGKDPACGTDWIASVGFEEICSPRNPHSGPLNAVYRRRAFLLTTDKWLGSGWTAQRRAFWLLTRDDRDETKRGSLKRQVFWCRRSVGWGSCRAYLANGDHRTT
jgi:hypothetical protein